MTGCLAADAERVLTDTVLVRMVAHGSVIGPFRPAHGLIRRSLRAIRSALCG